MSEKVGECEADKVYPKDEPKEGFQPEVKTTYRPPTALRDDDGKIEDMKDAQGHPYQRKWNNSYRTYLFRWIGAKTWGLSLPPREAPPAPPELTPGLLSRLANGEISGAELVFLRDQAEKGNITTDLLDQVRGLSYNQLLSLYDRIKVLAIENKKYREDKIREAETLKQLHVIYNKNRLTLACEHTVPYHNIKFESNGDVRCRQCGKLTKLNIKTSLVKQP